MKLRELGLGSDEDGDVGVGVFPLYQKILIDDLRFNGVTGAH